MTKMKIGFARSILAVIGLFAATASLWAGDATWNFRSGVGVLQEDRRPGTDLYPSDHFPITATLLLPASGDPKGAR